ncbi:hypothetical protein BOX15_Mlig011511g2 [Macrostomum lignano]|uniref:glutamate synthase (NADH) n=2 Tax=Macrostomum lignano TaxID=282301 RepID=A0A267DS94_9PLAT|nr:hypothetical protein BOX15_Mlig011511g2 [Macrostomum lignano]
MSSQELQKVQERRPFHDYPSRQGLYDPSLEKDACGVGFVVQIKGVPSKQILKAARTMLLRMEHRGACGSDNSGDGAGVLTGIPHELYAESMSKQGVTLPQPGRYATGILFLENGLGEQITQMKSMFVSLVAECGLNFLGWREVEKDASYLGQVARASEPIIVQVFVSDQNENFKQTDFDKKVYMLRKYSNSKISSAGHRFYVCSLSSKTIVYKGQFNTKQLWQYYKDLQSPDFSTHVAIVHSRFSTNTFPSWERAHPHRMLAHNGEINTLRGNVNYMRSREGVMTSEYYGEKLPNLYPVIEPEMSDSGALDNVLEFLYNAGGRSIPEAVCNLIPEAWQNDSMMDADKKAYYRWSAYSLEPWDGPALVTFSDGRYTGAVLDRNGLRPARYYVTEDDVMYMSSEVGVADVPDESVLRKGRLKPGGMLLVDTKRQRVVEDVDLKHELASLRPIDQWICEQSVGMEDLRRVHKKLVTHPRDRSLYNDDRRLPLFGFTNETTLMLLIPMISNEKEALGSMGNDAPLACLSSYNPLLFEYFKQLFAQVTNPPIDPFRESVVMTLECPIGPEANILEPSAKQCRRLWLRHPILSLHDMEVLRSMNYRGMRTKELDMCYPQTKDLNALEARLNQLCEEAEKAIVRENYSFVLLSDRKAGQDFIPVPSLAAIGAVHQYLVEKKLRLQCGLLLESAEPREVHHLCTVLGFGADAVCPYLVYETIAKIRDERRHEVLKNMTDDDIYKSYASATKRGIFKVMAKMGISSLHSYKGAQIFEAVGLGDDVMSKCFTGTASRIGGVSFRHLAAESLARFEYAYSDRQGDNNLVNNPGYYHWRSGGESHINEPSSVANLQEAARLNSPDAYKKFAEQADQSSARCTIRGQLDFAVDSAHSIDLDLVEPAASIVRRFATGAMSFGSISYETHTTLAIAMNQLGGKSNTGEGGELAQRYLNPTTRSAIKQVASGRFGVNSAYLTNADEIQIKMAQGAKPGEGGELPGYKVTDEIAACRSSIAGVGLISPPPHHDIYSIEDLAQLIYDLKSANPSARISVKLVSEIGVGVVASGVVKGKAEHVTISGHDGGTGASSWTGIKHAGLPWELGLSETHQTLVLNDLRSRVVLQADGQLRTGRDVVMAALLGADEFGFSTAPLIVLGCTLMRKCHLNTCPVGIATQDPILRKKFAGQPEHVINYMFMLAEEVRGYMAKLGFRSMKDMIGRVDKLRPKDRAPNRKPSLLTFDSILYNASAARPEVLAQGGCVAQEFRLEDRVDFKLIEDLRDVIESRKPSAQLSLTIGNKDRAFGSTLSWAISKRHGETGLPEGAISLNLTGHAGQSFCAFLTYGVSIRLEGDACDYVAKGLSGGRVVVVPPASVNKQFASEDNIIVGNVCLYGAVKGIAMFRGQAAERFCVRNSGALAVCEGCGDHGCEYMTGGTVIILGPTGRNFAAGMSGGIAYIYDIGNNFRQRCNKASVDILPVIEPDDLKLLRQVLTEFVAETGSQRAQQVLNNFDEIVGTSFLKVFPHEFQRVLKEAKAKPETYSHLSLQKQSAMSMAARKPLSQMVENQDIDFIGDIDDEENEREDELVKTTVASRHKQPPKQQQPSANTSNSTSAASAVSAISTATTAVSTVDTTAVNGGGNSSGLSDIEDIIHADGSKPLKLAKLDKVRGFVKYPRAKYQYKEVQSRADSWDEIFNHSDVQRGLRLQSARCMDCGIPFCQSNHGCPLGNIIPRFNDLVFRHQWQMALETLLQTNNFPEFTGRVCPAPCEAACCLGINAPPVTIKDIENTIIEHAFEHGWIAPEIPPSRTGRRIAVVGSGPSGLACAAQLNKAGHLVTIFERNTAAGGLLRYGIPSMKLSKAVVERRVALMEASGIEFRCGVNVGNGQAAAQLLQQFDAICLCTGATWPRDIPVPGRNLNGIHFAMSFLENWQKTQSIEDYGTDLALVAKDKDIVVLGGGDTGVDCLGTALRQGARSLTTFEILPEPPATRSADNPWPQWPKVFKRDYGHEEVKLRFGKDPRVFSIATKEFIDDGNGNVAGVKTCKVNWTKDVAGRWVMSEVPDTEQVYKADLVLLAMGFLGPEKHIVDELNLQCDPRSNIEAVVGSYRTSVPRVYAAGDCRRGQSLVVHAINEGRQAAREIDYHLMGRSYLAGPGGLVRINYIKEA